MADILNFFTERLSLRPVRPEDAEAIFNYRQDPVTNRYQGWIPENISETLDFITKRVSSEIDIDGTWFQLVIISIDTHHLIGDIGIHFPVHSKFQVEIGCTLNRDQQGKGFATEALGEVISYLFNNLNKRRITASIDPGNEKSISLVKRLGFRQEAHFRQSILINGVWCDDLIFALLKDDWLNRPAR